MKAEPAARRLSWLLIVLLSASVLVTARLLTPAPQGVGTHTQLGLPPCGFLVVFGLPCPACGLTTAFAHLARLELGASLQAHWLGLPLFALTWGLLGVGLSGLARGASLQLWLARPSVRAIAVGVGIALLAVWLVRLLTAA